jgi:hypothetical protein
MNLNGSAALAESLRIQLGNVRRDWTVEAATMRAELARGLLELERTCAAMRDRVLELKDGAPGLNGAPGEPGKPGEPGPAGLFVPPRPFKAGAITYRGELVYHEGSTFAALVDTPATPPHADFQPIAYRGRDAYPGRARGLWDPACNDYRAMDVVSLNGSEWRANVDNPGPCPGDGWMLGAKGSKGKPGEKGDRGEPGPVGNGFVHVERLEDSLVFTRADGSAITIDIGAMIV